MKTHVLARVCVALILFPLLVSPCPAQKQAATVSLFDGRTLDGWDGDRKYWRVEEGAIVGEIPPQQRLRKNTWLICEAAN